MSKEEKAFIEENLIDESGDGADNVFFVVNRINQVNRRDVDDIKGWVRSALAPVFVDGDGEFDEALYRRRVFYVDALGALDARESESVDEAALEASGVPALERELERFLTGAEKLAATLGATVQAARGVAEDARRTIAQRKAALDQPLAVLERRRGEAEVKLKDLEREKLDIELTINRAADTVKTKTFADLLGFLNEMRDTWPQDSGLDGGGAGLVSLDALTMWDIVKAVMGNAAAKNSLQALSTTPLNPRA